MPSNPKTSKDWAYDFASELSMEAMLEALEKAGPWTWTQRENYVEGSYLNTRPAEGVHIKINEHPQAFVDRGDQAGFSALLRTRSDDPAFRQELDQTLIELLKRVGASELVAIDPYD
ncbi:hypothetical protein [Wenzhouxiangella marina]|uniref:Uncharacterized protein n=1 Tax=Wenzhouxiangella marina TaxID=1579979 RepID=A0A0K0XZZ0_9GAMM|nr:hypothetical protein [Wenzhouxiangella marina]AKS43202.1 hypothetical protein WM2015_2845 [Wenzhouxiangella marina]MBB6087112.1 hypothetical protein [Wenzhouxiangella marina]